MSRHLGFLLVIATALLGAAADLSAAPTVTPPLLAVHAARLRDGRDVFVSRQADLRRIAQVFNGIIVGYGDPDLVVQAREAGLRVHLEFDRKRDFGAGRDISDTVAAVIQQVRAQRGAIAGIRVANEINYTLDPAQSVAYLRATGGVFHREIPGVPVLVDVVDWEFTCGTPGHMSCTQHLATQYRFGRHHVLRSLYESGYVDGFYLSTGLRALDPDLHTRAWRQARTMFPPPFILLARTARLSFADARYPHDGTTARRQVEAYVRAPVRGGADGVDLWAWHRSSGDGLRTLLDKDGSGNALWDALAQAAREMGVR